jgi:CheY-like chemotaxis protein/HPt (histidine-containing phosphotransfer) domain-containing protein
VLGQYTTFTLEFLPIAATELAAHHAQLLQHAQLALTGKRLLLVDDSAAQRASTRALLAALPCQLDEADNGQAALAKLQQTRYDLLLMDLQMPVLDGYATTAQIRAGAVPAARCVPIVAYSSESAAVASVKTRQAGMNGFVSKPSDTLTLIASVQQALAQAAQQPHSNQDATPDLAVLRGKTLLVADDVDLNRQVVATYVQPWGMQVLEACHGMQVLEILVEQGQPVDLVLLDMQMPGLSGPRTAELLRQQNNLKSLPIVALTGFGDEASRQAAQAAGMNDFISKPIEVAVLQATLLRHLAAGTVQCRSAAIAAAANLKAEFVRAPQTSDALADWAALQNSPTPRPYIEREAVDLATLPLLDIKRLEDFKQRAPEFVAEMWADYAPSALEAQQKLRVALDNKNHADLHRVLHALVGNSGNMGAWALHRFLKCRVAPDVERGHWPREEHWLETLADLHARTQEAMREYLAG